MTTEPMIQLYTVNGGKPSAQIPLRRYEAMQKAILKVLKNKPEGLGFPDLAYEVSQRLPLWWTREGWDELWHATNVKLHLEYLGQLERVPGAKPHRVRIVASSGADRSVRQSSRTEPSAPLNTTTS